MFPWAGTNGRYTNARELERTHDVGACSLPIDLSWSDVSNAGDGRDVQRKFCRRSQAREAVTVDLTGDDLDRRHSAE